jgi:hypothetical protein
VREEGRDPALHRLFETLKDAQTYVKERWQGTDYIDGDDEFHTDYCTYTLFGFKLKDIGRRDLVDFYMWIWREL